MDKYKIYTFIEDVDEVMTAEDTFKISKDLLVSPYIKQNIMLALSNATCVVSGYGNAVDSGDILTEYNEIERELLKNDDYINELIVKAKTISELSKLAIDKHTNMANYHTHKTGQLFPNKKQILIFVRFVDSAIRYMNATDYIHAIKETKGHYYTFQY